MEEDEEEEEEMMMMMMMMMMLLRLVDISDVISRIKVIFFDNRITWFV